MIKARAITTLLALALSVVSAPRAEAKINPIEITQRNAEMQVRNLLEPLLDRYCRDECRIMSIKVAVDVAVPEEVAPGFDDIDPKSQVALSPTAARIKLMIDDKVGPVSRAKLLELIQLYLDNLDFKAIVEPQVAHFPQPSQSAGKVAELRDKITRQFRDAVDEMFKQFCPNQCMLAEYKLSTELVNAEEAQYGASGEFFQDGDTAIRIRTLSATILMDESLSNEERGNILEMAKLRTSFLKNVELGGKSLKFPKPKWDDEGGEGGDVAGTGSGRGRKIASKSEKASLEAKSTELKDQKSVSSSAESKTTEAKTDTKSEHKSESKNESNVSTDNKNNTTNNTNETNAKTERYERFEKIERVENGDAVQAELKKFKVYGLIFACSILSLLIFLIMASMRPRDAGGNTIHKIVQTLSQDPATSAAPTLPATSSSSNNEDRAKLIAMRYEIERLIEELSGIYAQQPKVAKLVFSRILTEEGVEVMAQFIHIFGEGIVMDMLRDPSLQNDVNELMEFYARNPIEMTDEEKLELLRVLHNRTVAAKMVAMGKRTSNLFDFLHDMDGTQIAELIRTESLTVKAIALTQCDLQKRGAIFSTMDEDTRMKLLNELPRIDYLPSDYIFNVATALKRKRRENPKLNTEALPGSEVLVGLLERTPSDTQKAVVKTLEMSNPDSARTIKSKLVSIDTLRFLRDGQLLEVVLSLRHDELLQFLKGTPPAVKQAIFAKSPKDLVVELEEELVTTTLSSREAYQGIERKVINRMKVMATEGLINLVETNDRMLGEGSKPDNLVEAGPARGAAQQPKRAA